MAIRKIKINTILHYTRYVHTLNSLLAHSRPATHCTHWRLFSSSSARNIHRSYTHTRARAHTQTQIPILFEQSQVPGLTFSMFCWTDDTQARIVACCTGESSAFPRSHICSIMFSATRWACTFLFRDIIARWSDEKLAKGRTTKQGPRVPISLSPGWG